MHRTKICYVTTVDLDEIGGAITSEMKMLRNLRKLGDVDVIYLPGTKFRSTTVAFFLYALKILRSISKPFELYFCRGLVSTFLVMLCKPLFNAKVVHQALSVPLPSKEVKYLEHGRTAQKIRYYLFGFFERIALKQADAITVADDNYAKELIEIGIEKDRIKTVPFYVENKFFEQPIRLGGKVFKICYVGRFHQYHDLSAIIEAFELVSHSLHDIELILVGDGPLRPQVERATRQGGIVGRVIFVGMVPHLAVPSLLAEMDSFVYIIHKSGLSTSLLEAAAAGKAIITLKRKNDDTLSRFFKHRKDVYLVNTSSASEIAEAMDLLYKDSELRNTIAQGAREVAKRHFSEDANLKRLRILLDSL